MLGGYHRPVRVRVHDRTESLPVRLADYAEQRLARLSRHFDKVTEAEIAFDAESRRSSNAVCGVQIIVRTDGRRHPLMRVHETAPDHRAALDLALDKIDRQIVKLKEKIKLERKRAAAIAAEAEREAVPSAAPGVPERTRLKLLPESLADAEAGLDTGDLPFYVFLDEASGLVDICYRRPDGGLAVIEVVT